MITGTVSQLITLTSFGNHDLNNAQLPATFYPANQAFQFCNIVDFRKLSNSSDTEATILAANPIEWYKYLKESGCNALRLAYNYSENQAVQDYRTAGLVGGGGTWLIEADYGDYSNYWGRRWSMNTQKTSDNRIWNVNYMRIAEEENSIYLEIDRQQTRTKLSKALTEIASFAFMNNEQQWGKIFEQAKDTLESATPEKGYAHRNLIPLPDYSLPDQQLLFSAVKSWVFGNQDSWNDLNNFDNEEDEQRYDELSAELYALINAAIMAVINNN